MRISGHFIPTRTSSLPDVSLPTRTEHSSDDYSPYQIDEDSRNLIFMTRTTFPATYTPIRTTMEKIDTSDNDIPNPNIHEEGVRRYETKQKSDKELDASYNMMFYDEETSKGDVKTEVYDERDKHDESSTSVNYDEHKEKGENDLKEAAAISGTKEDIEMKNVPSKHLTIESFRPGDYEKERENTSVVELIKEPASIMELKDRFKIKVQSCNLIKIRALAFSTPHTLHEVSKS